MKNIKLDDYVDTFDEFKLDELVKSLRFLSSLDGFGVCSESDDCEKMNLDHIEGVVEVAADLIQRYISELRRNDISKATYEAFTSLARYSYLLTTALIRLHEWTFDPFVSFETNLEFLEQDYQDSRK